MDRQTSLKIRITLVHLLQISVFSILLIKSFALKRRGSYILLDEEKEDLLYFLESQQKWEMCKMNNIPIDDYKYFKQGYIIEDCYKANINKTSPKNAWFNAMTPNTVYPICDSKQLGIENNFIWKCENGLSPMAVTPYRNCSLVCKSEHSNASTNVKVRCGVNLEWIWYGKMVNQASYCSPVQETELKRKNDNELHIAVGCSVAFGIIVIVMIVAVLLNKRYKADSYWRVPEVSSSTTEEPCIYSPDNYKEQEVNTEIPPGPHEAKQETDSLNQREIISNGSMKNQYKEEPCTYSPDNYKEEQVNTEIPPSSTETKQEICSLIQREIIGKHCKEDQYESTDTLAEGTIRYDESYQEEHGLRADILSDCLDSCLTLSVNTLNNQSASVPVYHGMVAGNRTDIPQQRHLDKNSETSKLELPFTCVDLLRGSAPELSSEMYSSGSTSKNKHHSIVVHLNDVRESAAPNYRNSDIDISQCTLLIVEALENGNLAFFETLACCLDPDREYGKSKSWYGLTLSVLKVPVREVNRIRHHFMGNVEGGHFMNTLEHYISQGKHMSDIVNYFVQRDTQRPDVVKLFSEFHKDCQVCSSLYSRLGL